MGVLLLCSVFSFMSFADDLNVKLALGDFESALKLVNKRLAIAKGNLDPLRIKKVSILISLNRADEGIVEFLKINSKNIRYDDYIYAGWLLYSSAIHELSTSSGMAAGWRKQADNFLGEMLASKHLLDTKLIQSIERYLVEFPNENLTRKLRG